MSIEGGIRRCIVGGKQLFYLLSAEQVERTVNPYKENPTYSECTAMQEGEAVKGIHCRVIA